MKVKFTDEAKSFITVAELPKKTHYCEQIAIVTIFDPVMKHIEQYIRT